MIFVVYIAGKGINIQNISITLIRERQSSGGNECRKLKKKKKKPINTKEIQPHQ